MVDVLVAGAGPAGWSLASACARLGLSVLVVAPRPVGAWRATYGLWLDEAAVLPPGSRYVTARPRGLSRWYAVLDNASVQASLRDSAVRTRAGLVRGLVPGGVRLADGEVLAARVVVDATGGPRGRVQQTAFGVVVPAAVAAPVVGAGEAVFMDWRGDGSTFLYAVPVADGRVLLEETSLARRPGMGMRELRERLCARLAGHGIVLGAGSRDAVALAGDATSVTPSADPTNTATPSATPTNDPTNTATSPTNNAPPATPTLDPTNTATSPANDASSRTPSTDPTDTASKPPDDEPPAIPTTDPTNTATGPTNDAPPATSTTDSATKPTNDTRSTTPTTDPANTATEPANNPPPATPSTGPTNAATGPTNDAPSDSPNTAAGSANDAPSGFVGGQPKWGFDRRSLRVGDRFLGRGLGDQPSVSLSKSWPPAPGINSTGGDRQSLGGCAVERVRFAVDVPAPPPVGRGAIPFGAAAGFVHPATGFSIADTFRLAPAVAAAIARTINLGPLAVDLAARHAMWSPAARIVHRLRRRGLAALLALPPESVPEFFELFFALPERRQIAYLSGRDDVVGTAAAMAALYRSAPGSLRRVMAGLRQTGESERGFMNNG